MKRRALCGAGVAALAGGVGVQQWQARRGAAAEAEAVFWGSSFPTPADGPPLVMASLRGRPLLLNFWATWCPPCLREMPEIERFHTAHAARGWQVLGLAADRAESVRVYLSRQPVSYAIALAGLEGVEMTALLGNISKGLPYTVLFDAAGKVVRRKAGETNLAELTAWAAAVT
jgi:thiol-disulfide isomerase/thioredoxin